MAVCPGTPSSSFCACPPPARLALNRPVPVQFPPIFQAIARVAVVAAPILGRALVDAYRQGMISAAPPSTAPLRPTWLVCSLHIWRLAGR